MSVFVKASASRPLRAALSGVALMGAGALVLSGCTGGGSTPEAADPTESSEETMAAGECAVNEIEAGERDLTMKIGTILPQSGELSYLGPPEEAGVQLGADEVNAASAGLTVEAIFRDSGDTTTDTATVSVTDLLSQDVSAIIGAASSGVSLTVIDQITGAGVVQISPANTSPDFTDYDDDNLYWRTAPSDLLQGEVLGNLIAEDGNATLGLIVLNDAYGTGLAEVTKESFEAAGGEVVAEALFNEGDTNFDTQISEVTAANPDAIALITFAQANALVPALVGTGFPKDKLYFVDGNLKDQSTTGVWSPGLVEGSKGTLPGGALEEDVQQRLLAVDPALEDYAYAGESYDAVVLTALAAYAANDTSGEAIAEYLCQVSGGAGDGEKVSTFEEGAALLAEGEQIDYDGLSGPITFDANGDPTEAVVGIYEYKADNSIERIN